MCVRMAESNLCARLVEGKGGESFGIVEGKGGKV